jgi:hypothetical protein
MQGHSARLGAISRLKRLLVEAQWAIRLGRFQLAALREGSKPPLTRGNRSTTGSASRFAQCSWNGIEVGRICA